MLTQVTKTSGDYNYVICSILMRLRVRNCGEIIPHDDFYMNFKKGVARSTGCLLCVDMRQMLETYNTKWSIRRELCFQVINKSGRQPYTRLDNWVLCVWNWQAW